MTFTSGRRRALRDGLALAGLLFGGYLFGVTAPATGTVGFDAWAYWTVDLEHPYRLGSGALGAFRYSPVMARAFAPVALLPWPTFLFAWLAVLVGSVAWLGWRRSLLVLAFPPVTVDLYHGNINLLIAVAIALGFRYPAAWAFILLTKVTPGVGLLWFAVRREWRALAIALGVTGAIAVVSVALDGRLWEEWIRDGLFGALQHPLGQPEIPLPLWLRLPASAVLVAWGARTDRRWTVAASAALALPVLWFGGLSILAAIATLDRPALREREAAR